MLLLLVLALVSCENNIKTLPEDLTMIENPLKECPDSPNCFRTTQFFEYDSSTVFSAIKTAVDEIGVYETETESDSLSKNIKAIFKIPVFGWLDDVDVVVIADNDNKDNSIVFIRSASREGYYDIGVNKRRVNKILKFTRKQLNKK
jgi:uncharacterized protein (DUF1499 family)